MKLDHSAVIVEAHVNGGCSIVRRSPVLVRVRVRVRAVLVSLNFLYTSVRVRTAPPVSVKVRNRVSVSFSFSGKLTTDCRIIEPSDYRTFGLSIQNHVNMS